MLYTPEGEVTSKIREEIGIRIINKGFRTIKVDSLTIEYAPGHYYDLQNLLKKERKLTFPVKIGEGEDLTIFIPQDILDELKQKGDFEEFYFILENSLGKIYSKKIKDNLIN